jgi:hypothetical protein
MKVVRSAARHDARVVRGNLPHEPVTVAHLDHRSVQEVGVLVLHVRCWT